MVTVVALPRTIPITGGSVTIGFEVTMVGLGASVAGMKEVVVNSTSLEPCSIISFKYLRYLPLASRQCFVLRCDSRSALLPVVPHN